MIKNIATFLLCVLALMILWKFFLAMAGFVVKVLVVILIIFAIGYWIKDMLG